MLKHDVKKAMQAVLAEAGIKQSLEVTGANIDALETVIADAIARGEGVRLTGFLSVETKEVAEREIKTPVMKEAKVVPAHTKASIKLASALRKA